MGMLGKSNGNLMGFATKYAVMSRNWKNAVCYWQILNARSDWMPPFGIQRVKLVSFWFHIPVSSRNRQSAEFAPLDAHFGEMSSKLLNATDWDPPPPAEILLAEPSGIPSINSRLWSMGVNSSTSTTWNKMDWLWRKTYQSVKLRQQACGEEKYYFIVIFAEIHRN